MPEPLLVARARTHGGRWAVAAPEGRFRYPELLEASHRVATALARSAGPLAGARVASLIPPGFHWVAAQWGIWRAGAAAVPLAVSHPPPELEYVIADCGARAVVAHPELADRVRPIADRLGIPLVSSVAALAVEPGPLPAVVPGAGAQVFYTSGTTGKPKGVLLTHRNLAAQIESLVAAWEWSADDRILSVLPLHHVHGVVNVVGSALWAGALCEFLPRFEPEAVWRRLAAGGLTLFMAVPTIYARLLAAWERAQPAERARWSEAAGRLRLMVSGSAPLPASLLAAWRAATGHTLLERYGMTEIGMALSNPVRGPRVPGHVGWPLPGVEVRLVDEEGREVAPGTPGEIEVRGPGVFQEYLGRPEETRAAFRDGWFRTGDVAVQDPEGYRLLGRKSVDLIKAGGYKISALEVEEALRQHPDVADCAVVGLPDPEWGELVAAAIVPRAEAASDPAALRQWLRQRLAPYKVPRRLVFLDHLPRNAMGKVLKGEVAARLVEPGG